MKSFVVMVVVSLFFVLFAEMNRTVVPIAFGTFSFNAPVSLVTIIPVGLTLLLFALYHLGKMRKAELVIRDLEDNVESAQKQVLEITKRTHELEIENRKYKIRLGEETDVDEQSL